MNEKYIPPRDFTPSTLDSLHQTSFEKSGYNEIQVIGTRVIHEDSHSKITENVVCNGKDHWREHITVNILDNITTEKRDPIPSPCNCFAKRY